MPPLSFEERATSGRYDKLAAMFDGATDSLATVDYGTHFTAYSTGWRDGDIKNYRTTFSATDQTPEEATEELVVNIIGEVAREGSELSARGNAWLRPNQKIVDKTSVRDVLVLALPMMATASLTILYENQIRTIEDMEDNVALPVPKVCAASSHLSVLILSCRPPKSPTVLGQRTLKGRQSSSPCR